MSHAAPARPFTGTERLGEITAGPRGGYRVWSDSTIWTHISAVQTDGSVRTCDGTYTVANGEIVSANITQTS